MELSGMDSGIEVSPDPLSKRVDEDPDLSDTDEPPNKNRSNVTWASSVRRNQTTSDDDDADDSDSDFSLNVHDTVYLIPEPVSKNSEYPEGLHPVSSWGSVQTDLSGAMTTANTDDHEEAYDLFLLQAQVFIEDAATYRSIDHRVDLKSLRVYQFYHSRPFSMFRSFVILVLHMLAFFEFPSSLTWTADIRTREHRPLIPCGVTESIELLCLVFLMADFFIKSRIYGNQYIRTNRWLLVAVLVLGGSFVDWSVSLAIGCTEVVRIRRMLRPVFIIQNSSLMKKIINSLRKSVSQILGVLMLMFLHLYIFTLFGMLLFPKQGQERQSNGDDLDVEARKHNHTGNSTQGNAESGYFRTLTGSFMNLLVLLTTANNPDVTLPAYSENRLYAVFFIVFLIIGLYCFMNMLTAIIYNQFRGYFLSSMQHSLMRRRLGQRAAFEALKNKSTNLNQSSMEIGELEDVLSHGVAVRDLKTVIARAKISKEMKVLLGDTIAVGYQEDDKLTWNKFLSVLRMMEMEKHQQEKPSIRWFQHPRLVKLQKIVCHRYFSYFGNVMALSNVVLISFELATEYDKSMNSSQSTLRIINFLFIFYYFVEQSVILFCMGWKRYRYSWANLYDGIIVIILLVSEVVTVSLYGFPFFSQRETHNNLTLWNIVRVINILIMLRLLRVIWHIKTMAIVAHTLLDLVKNLQSFGGILIVIYYFFAILGMEIFQNKIVYSVPTGNKSELSCGTYEQLEYWANNFDDFAAAIVVLWNIMVVNNWQVFLDVYAKYTTKWSYLYFIVWWLTSVVIVLNLFTALILENFIMKWDKFHHASRMRQQRRDRSGSSTFNMNTLTVHDIFKSDLKEPTEAEILQSMSRLKYFNLKNNIPNQIM